MADGPGGEKTQQATGKKRQEARDRGEVARSQELNSGVVLLLGMTVLLACGGHFSRVLGRNAAYIFSEAPNLVPTTPGNIRYLLAGNMKVLMEALAPLLLTLIIAAFGVNFAQVGWHFSSQSLGFKSDKLNPLEGMKKFFKKTAFFELGKNILKISIIGLLAYSVVHGLIWKLMGAAQLPLPAVVNLGKSSLVSLMARLLAFAMVLGVIDWIWQKRQFEENLKMTKDEVKQEHKDIEGDPQVRARIKGLQYKMAQKRMLADVPTADVVVTNPTHFAVALKYRPGDPAPVVLAKGADSLAQKIKEIARNARVPVLENKPLARSLYRQVEVGQFIPDSLFQAVAEVLAYVFRLRKA